MDAEEVLRGDLGRGSPAGEGLHPLQLPPPAAADREHGGRGAHFPGGAGEADIVAAGPGDADGAHDTVVQPHVRDVAGHGTGRPAGEEVREHRGRREERSGSGEGGEAGGLLPGGGGGGFEPEVVGVRVSCRRSPQPRQSYR